MRQSPDKAGTSVKMTWDISRSGHIHPGHPLQNAHDLQHQTQGRTVRNSSVGGRNGASTGNMEHIVKK